MVDGMDISNNDGNGAGVTFYLAHQHQQRVLDLAVRRQVARTVPQPPRAREGNAEFPARANNRTATAARAAAVLRSRWIWGVGGARRA